MRLILYNIWTIFYTEMNLFLRNEKMEGQKLRVIDDWFKKR